MTFQSPFGGGSFFEEMLNDLLKALGRAGEVQWDLARQMALSAATQGEAEPNVDPMQRIRLEELLRVAELNVVAQTGLGATTAKPLELRALGRGSWAVETLEAWRPLLEPLTAPAQEPEMPEEPSTSELGEEGRLGNLLASLGRTVGPALSAMMLGSSIGHLARRALGQYDFPIPRPLSNEIILVPANIASLAADWSLPADDFGLWVCVNEVAHHAVLSLPHVRNRVTGLLAGYVAGYRYDTSAIEQSLSALDPTNPESLEEALSEGSFLGIMRETPEQAVLRGDLEVLVEAIEGYVDWVTEAVGRRLLGSFAAIDEALRRRRIERPSGERFMERLFGLELSQRLFDTAAAFVGGVIERAGPGALAELWARPENLPTKAEIDAPGLWLERIGLGS